MGVPCLPVGSTGGVRHGSRGRVTTRCRLSTILGRVRFVRSHRVLTLRCRSRSASTSTAKAPVGPGLTSRRPRDGRSRCCRASRSSVAMRRRTRCGRSAKRPGPRSRSPAAATATGSRSATSVGTSCSTATVLLATTHRPRRIGASGSGMRHGERDYDRRHRGCGGSGRHLVRDHRRRDRVGSAPTGRDPRTGARAARRGAAGTPPGMGSDEPAGESAVIVGRLALLLVGGLGVRVPEEPTWWGWVARVSAGPVMLVGFAVDPVGHRRGGADEGGRSTDPGRLVPQMVAGRGPQPVNGAGRGGRPAACGPRPRAGPRS